jgi:hypothetical protein
MYKIFIIDKHMNAISLKSNLGKDYGFGVPGSFFIGFIHFFNKTFKTYF